MHTWGACVSSLFFFFHLLQIFAGPIHAQIANQKGPCIFSNHSYHAMCPCIQNIPYVLCRFKGSISCFLSFSHVTLRRAKQLMCFFPSFHVLLVDWMQEKNIHFDCKTAFFLLSNFSQKTKFVCTSFVPLIRYVVVLETIKTKTMNQKPKPKPLICVSSCPWFWASLSNFYPLHFIY
jgi:hypothetical protein